MVAYFYNHPVGEKRNIDKPLFEVQFDSSDMSPQSLSPSHT